MREILMYLCFYLRLFAVFTFVYFLIFAVKEAKTRMGFQTFARISSAGQGKG